MGWGGSKKSKLVITLSRGVRLKSCPILAPIKGHYLCGVGKIHAGRSREGRVKQGGEKLPFLCGKVVGKENERKLRFGMKISQSRGGNFYPNLIIYS